MQISSIFSAALLGFVTFSSAISVSYDTGYDDKFRSLNVVSCSDGVNGLVTRYGWQTQGDIPATYVGGYEGIAGYNSDMCGTCYSVSYNGNSIYVYAIDHTDTGFNIGAAGLNALTNGQAVQLGRVDAAYVQVDISNCGV